MLQLIRNHSISAAILVILIAVLLRLPGWYHIQGVSLPDAGPLSGWLMNALVSTANPLEVSYILATALVILQAFLLNYIVARHDVLYKDTYLPALMFVVLSSLYPEQMYITPQLLATSFILLLLLRLCYLYEAPNPLLPMVDAGIYLGIGLLFNYDLILFLPYILISVVVFTKFSVRYILVALIGVFIPFYFIATYFYLNNQQDTLLLIMRKSIEGLEWRPGFSSYEQLVPWVFIIGMGMVGTFQLQQNFFRNKVKTRRVLQSIAVLFVFALLTVLLENNNVVYALYYINIPVSIVLGYYFISTKRLWLREFLFFTIVGLSLYYNIR